MRKTSLLVAAFCWQILSSFAQSATGDSTTYSERKLSVEEVNFVSGYYHQDGDHSAVTGGIGTENLTDIANTLDLKLAWKGKRGLKHTVLFEAGVDHYTSASSGNIRLPGQGSSNTRHFSLTGPSNQDTRVYPSLVYGVENAEKRLAAGLGISYSHEYDYQSRGFQGYVAKTSKDGNREVSLKAMAFFDLWTDIYPYEVRPPGYSNGSHEGEDAIVEPRNSFQGTLTLSQVIHKRLQAALLIDPSYQQGQLTTLYQRVFFADSSVHAEKLPATRLKLPVGVRLNYFLGDRMVLRAWYRYYRDDWGNTAHTASLEAAVKVSPFVSLIPFGRYSRQSGIDYFAPYREHTAADTYYTSDYDLSPLTSRFLGMGFRMVPRKGVFGVQAWNSLEVRYGYYHQDTGLYAHSVTLAMKFK
jgi:hypothetical protein